MLLHEAEIIQPNPLNRAFVCILNFREDGLQFNRVDRLHDCVVIFPFCLDDRRLFR